MSSILDRAAAAPRSLSRDELRDLLLWPDAKELFAAALALRERVYGRNVALRGLVEIGNICAKNCFYCGIRRGNGAVKRYAMEKGEIVAAAKWAFDAGYGSAVLQAGERSDPAWTDFIEEVLREIHAFGGDGFGITLSLGEQTEETYRRWRDAGAHRYLLRIETSNPGLYAKLHPADHSWEARRECLRALRRCGYQVGTGVMCALPGQTPSDLASDIEFYAAEDVDMIGMGPYIPHAGTPLGAGIVLTEEDKARRLELGLRMIAAARLYLHDVNIAAATALQALRHDGREAGILAGANVIMPNITPARYRVEYQLYAGKPCLDENAAQCRGCIERRLAAAGETILWNKRGDSPRALSRGV